MKQIIESIGNLLKNFTKESNKVKVFLYLLGFILIFFIGYYFYNLQQETIKSNLEFQKIAQEEKNKRIEAELEKDKLQAQNQGKVIDSMKDLKSDNEIGGNVNGSIGNNNTTSNQTNSGGIIANSTIENSSVNIVNLVISDYTKYSSGELSKYINDLKNKEQLKIEDADEIIKQVSNTPANTYEEKQKQEDLINTLFQKFSFDNKNFSDKQLNNIAGKIEDIYYDYWGVHDYPGCLIDLNKIIPFIKNGKYYLQLNFTYRLGIGSKTPYCYMYLPNNFIAEFQKRQLGYFNNIISKDEKDIMNWTWSNTKPIYNDGTPQDFNLYLKWNNLNGDFFSLGDIGKLDLKFNYKHPDGPTGSLKISNIIWSIRDNIIELVKN